MRDLIPRSRSRDVAVRRGEKSPLVGEVVIHQGPGYPGALGDLVDADLVVGPLPKNLRTQRKQLGAPILRR